MSGGSKKAFKSSSPTLSWLKQGLICCSRPPLSFTSPDIRYTRRANLIWLIVGLYLSEKVQMSAIVKKWPIAVKVDSLTRRLSRFLDNPAIRPAVWYRPVARKLLARSVGQTVTLIIDGTKISAGHQRPRSNDNPCVYRKLKLGRSGDEVRQGWRVI